MSRQFNFSMGTVQSSQYVGHQGIFQALPADYRWPWMPQSAVIFQADRSKENKRGNSALFVEPRGFSTQFDINNLRDMNRRGYKKRMINKSVILPQALNEERFGNIQNSNSSNNNSSRRKKTKNKKRKKSRQALQRQVENCAIDNSADVLRQQNPHRWNHVPVMNWSQPDSEIRSSNFQNSLRYRFESYNFRNENGQRSQNVTPNEGLNSMSDLFHLNITRKVAPLYENFESSNLQLKNSEKYVSDIVSNKNSITTILNAADKKDDDDIEYLFTVDPSSKYHMVLEMDLLSDRINVIPSSEAADLIEKSKINDVPVNNSTREDRIVPPHSRKRKLSKDDKRDNKRPNQPKCTICRICYDDVIKQEQQMLFSNCNHTFCLPCITKNRASKVCPACGDKFLSFRRLFCD